MNRSNVGRALAAIVLALAGGCAGAPRTPARVARATETTCPAHVPGLVADTADLDGGGSLILTANADHVSDLRARVRRIVEIAESENGVSDADRERSWLLRSSLGTDDVPEGIRLDVRPENEGRARAVRDELEQIAIDLEAGRCPLAMSLE